MRSPTTSTIPLAAKVALAVLLLSLLFALGACRSKRTVQTTTTVQSTETHSGVSPRDTLIPVPPAHVEATLPLPPCGMDLPPTTARSDRAWSTVAIINGTLSHSGGCDSAALAATLWHTWERSHQDKVVTETLYEQVEVVRTPRWAWWALATALLLTLWRLWPLLRRIIKPL